MEFGRSWTGVPYSSMPSSSSSSIPSELLQQNVMEENVLPSPVYLAYSYDENLQNKALDYGDPFALRNMVGKFGSAKFGSVTKEIEDLSVLKKEMLKPYYKRHPMLAQVCVDKDPAIEAFENKQPVNTVRDLVVWNAAQPVVVIDSDDEEPAPQRPFQPYQDVILNKSAGPFSMKQFLENDHARGAVLMGRGASLSHESKKRKRRISDDVVQGENEIDSGEEKSKKMALDDDVVGREKDKGTFIGVEDDMKSDDSDQQSDPNFDGLADIWKEMTVGLEFTKDTASDVSSARQDEEECDHSFILKDDIGYVCRVCGVIKQGIETIIEYQYAKSSKNTRTYKYEGRTSRDIEKSEVHLDGIRPSGQEFFVAEISAHPRHKKQMKPHQVEGFNFLLSNLVAENPGGCILAHAPGSGKTFMLISFIQSFMAKYPDARPLVILPRGILSTWKREFKRWQVEEIPLHDCYSVKADSRVQQLEVLKQWANERSILFLGYKQFSSIVCDNDTGHVSASCQEILLTYPSILILDEGHTPRNQNTDVLTSLERVQTPRKVVLSGTLYQNHVKEVFNILNLVRPKFLRLESSKSIKKRILSKVPIARRKSLKTDNDFYELVEHTLLRDENFRRKVTVIEDLREMTSKVLHYYKGDFLDELPGLVDFSVFLNLTPRQKREVSELSKLSRKFKISSDGSAIYVHPEMKALAKNSTAKDRVDEGKIDELLENLDEREGVKGKFFLRLLRLCESAGERLLVFGQYLLPLKFLERLTMKVKGWSPGKEIFMITGDSDSEYRELAMERFNNSPDARVFFGSIKACGEGISLVGASRIIILDVHLNPSVTRQAIGRAFRPGQERKVFTYRLVAAGSPEEEDHSTCFRKESIAKMWFEWNEYCGHHDFEMETADVRDCGDEFLETSWLNEDIAALYRR